MVNGVWDFIKSVLLGFVLSQLNPFSSINAKVTSFGYYCFFFWKNKSPCQMTSFFLGQFKKKDPYDMTSFWVGFFF